MSENDVNSAPTAENQEAEGVNPSASKEQTDVTTEQPSEAQNSDVKPDDTAAPSPAEGVKKEPETMLDKVQEALTRKSDKAQEKPPVSKEDETKKPDADAEQKPKDEKPGENAEVPKEFAKHPAWQRIIKERDANKADASAYRNISGFMQENKISGKDAADALKLTALAYQNPVEFLKRIDDLAKNVRMQIGEVLPDDLQSEVDNGMISAERAKELSLARNRVAVSEQQVQRSTERVEQVDNAQDLKERERIFDGWAGQTVKTDPDLMKKLPLMQGELLKINAAEGYPQDHNAVIERLNRAYKNVNETVRAFVPQRKPVDPSPRQGANPAQVKTEPKTMLEAVESALNRRR